ncbi:MAG: hypothetical protein KatS3mg078_1320 [Deltaproteobacteria bacterium]|nr:MAG: hypothetical protein KatS3mg078_1320 [Deltaproteobacteria bacterium]
MSLKERLSKLESIVNAKTHTEQDPGLPPIISPQEFFIRVAEWYQSPKAQQMIGELTKTIEQMEVKELTKWMEERAKAKREYYEIPPDRELRTLQLGNPVIVVVPIPTKQEK